MVRWLGIIVCLFVALLAIGGHAEAQTGGSLNGVWVGQTTGNRVAITARPGGIDVAAVTMNAGQAQAPFFYYEASPGQYRHRFPDGTEAIVQFTGDGGLRVTNPGGWTDLFFPLGGSPAPAAAVADNLDGVWVGDVSGNRVSIARRSGGIDVAVVGQADGRVPALFFGGGSGEYRYNFPQGGQAIVRVLSPGVIRVSYPDGWSDTFRLSQAAVAAAPEDPDDVWEDDPPAPAANGGVSIMGSLMGGLGTGTTSPKAAPPAAAQPKPLGRKPRLVLRRQDGPSCLEYTMTVTLSDNRETWDSDFALTNNCSEPMLVRWDAGEVEAGGDESTMFVASNASPFVVGGTWVYWRGEDPSPLAGFRVSNRLGEGVRLMPGSSFTGRNFQPADGGAKDYVAWLVACPAYADKNGVRVAQSMFLSEPLLRMGAQFKCLPNVPFDG